MVEQLHIKVKSLQNECFQLSKQNDEKERLINSIEEECSQYKEKVRNYEANTRNHQLHSGQGSVESGIMNKMEYQAETKMFGGSPNGKSNVQEMQKQMAELRRENEKMLEHIENMKIERNKAIDEMKKDLDLSKSKENELQKALDQKTEE